MNEIVLSVDEFTELMAYIEELRKANKALNAEVAKYNEYAKEQNENK